MSDWVASVGLLQSSNRVNPQFEGVIAFRDTLVLWYCVTVLLKNCPLFCPFRLLYPVEGVHQDLHGSDRDVESV